ncbi:hypothetical protein FA13DRAFT_1739660 [Coprinellus micaceus]|uniref:F-box domain-containing protein n=1 Tax=Coprinellus micaceus TaxID=71717 RepID=A0A4Y7SPY8_COPMI|nr:hypothetical protein FA13DRAFT_1739660 [Coprinellus micaceus]
MSNTYQATENLPVELQDLISSFCSFDTLRSLAGVSRTFQAVAEQRLYASITIRTYERKESVLTTIAACAARASYVKSLMIDYYCLEPALVGNLVRALPHMKNLRELRIRLGCSIGNHHTAMLDDILSGAHFNLNVLFVEDHLDLRRIVEAQKYLGFLGVYETHTTAYQDSSSSPLSALSSLQNRCLPVVGLGTRGNVRGYGRVTLLPGLLSLEQAQSLDELVRHHFHIGENRKCSPGSDPEWVTTVVVHLPAAVDQDVFEAFGESVCRAFLNTSEVELVMNCGLVRVLSPLSPTWATFHGC